MTNLKSYNPDLPTIELFEDQVKDHNDYLAWKQLSATVGKPLSFTKRPPVRPANALDTTKKELEKNYAQLKEKAAKEGRIIWITDVD
jgi:hypothetical protein